MINNKRYNRKRIMIIITEIKINNNNRNKKIITITEMNCLDRRIIKKKNETQPCHPVKMLFPHCTDAGWSSPQDGCRSVRTFE